MYPKIIINQYIIIEWSLLNTCPDLYCLAQNAKKMAQKLGNDELALEYDKLSRWADNMSNMAEKVFHR